MRWLRNSAFSFQKLKVKVTKKTYSLWQKRKFDRCQDVVARWYYHFISVCIESKHRIHVYYYLSPISSYFITIKWRCFFFVYEFMHFDQNYIEPHIRPMKWPEQHINHNTRNVSFSFGFDRVAILPPRKQLVECIARTHANNNSTAIRGHGLWHCRTATYPTAAAKHKHINTIQTDTFEKTRRVVHMNCVYAIQVP